eukprot:c40798_g1_i1 orf=2-181(-)
MGKGGGGIHKTKREIPFSPSFYPVFIIMLGSQIELVCLVAKIYAGPISQLFTVPAINEFP